MSMLSNVVKTLGGRDVTTTGDFQAIAGAPPAVGNSLVSTMLNLVPIDVVITMAISVAIRVATTGTGNRAKQVKKVLLEVGKSVESTFPGEVCG